jgi:hypothetical protein
LLAGGNPGVRTIAEARAAGIAGADTIMRNDNHSMKPELVNMLKRDICPLMQLQHDPSASEIFEYWKAEAVQGATAVHSVVITRILLRRTHLKALLGSILIVYRISENQ